MWLIILFFAALLTAFALEHYEARIDQHVWLVMFIPLVISAGGRVGRPILDTHYLVNGKEGEIQLTDWVKVIREIAMGLMLGHFSVF